MQRVSGCSGLLVAHHTINNWNAGIQCIAWQGGQIASVLVPPCLFTSALRAVCPFPSQVWWVCLDPSLVLLHSPIRKKCQLCFYLICSIGIFVFIPADHVILLLLLQPKASASFQEDETYWAEVQGRAIPSQRMRKQDRIEVLGIVATTHHWGVEVVSEFWDWSLYFWKYHMFDLNWPPPNWGQIHSNSQWANQLILWLQGLVQWLN